MTSETEFVPTILDKVPEGLRKKLAIKMTLERESAMAMFDHVMKDLPYAVMCHSCGSTEIQVSVRGIEGKFCSSACRGRWKKEDEENEEVVWACFFGQDCPVCYGRYDGDLECEVSTVEVTSAHRKRRIQVGGPFWPMAAKRQCLNQCIKTRQPIRLPLPETPFWVEQAKERELKEGFKVFRKLEF